MANYLKKPTKAAVYMTTAIFTLALTAGCQTPSLYTAKKKSNPYEQATLFKKAQEQEEGLSAILASNTTSSDGETAISEKTVARAKEEYELIKAQGSQNIMTQEDLITPTFFNTAPWNWGKELSGGQIALGVGGILVLSGGGVAAGVLLSNNSGGGNNNTTTTTSTSSSNTGGGNDNGGGQDNGNGDGGGIIIGN